MPWDEESMPHEAPEAQNASESLPPKENLKSTYVYALVDPRTRLPRYVGRTVDPASRMTNHLSTADSPRRTAKRAWIAELLSLGLRPYMEFLEFDVPADRAQAVERSWIATLGERHDLLNADHGPTKR